MTNTETLRQLRAKSWVSKRLLHPSCWRRAGDDYEQQDGYGRLKRVVHVRSSGAKKTVGWVVWIDGRQASASLALAAAKAVAFELTRTRPLKPGDSLYHVTEYDHPNIRQHTWIVTQETVDVVFKDGRFSFKRSFGGRQIQRADAMGRRFHRTVEAAMDAFAAEQRDKIASLQRQIDEAHRAITWAGEES
jgi:hypothetical protein